MKTLRDLKRFILVKCAEGNQHEVRSYVLDNIDHLASAFHVRATTVMDAVEGVHEDGALAERLLETIMRAEVLLRQARKDSRAQAAQASAKVLASTVEWEADRAWIDMPSLLSSTLTRRQDVLVFQAEDFTVSIQMAALLDLAKIARVRSDLTGFVDRDGMHLRWRSGRLKLLAQKTDAKADQIVVSMPRKTEAAAA